VKPGLSIEELHSSRLVHTQSPDNHVTHETSTVATACIINSAEEGGYVFGSVCLSVCPSDYSQTCEQILTKFYGGVGHGSRTK